MAISHTENKSWGTLKTKIYLFKLKLFFKKRTFFKITFEIFFFLFSEYLIFKMKRINRVLLILNSRWFCKNKYNKGKNQIADFFLNYKVFTSQMSPDLPIPCPRPKCLKFKGIKSLPQNHNFLIPIPLQPDETWWNLD